MTKPLTKEHFAKIHELATERSELERKARHLGSEEKRLLAETADALDEAGKAKMQRGDFRAEFETKAGRIKWKDECLKRLKDGELQEMESAVPQTRRLKIHSIAAALLVCLLLTGCLKRDTDTQGPVPAFEPAPIDFVDNDPIVDAPTPPPVFPDADKSTGGYTGAVIYTGPSCDPCKALKHDLLKLCDARDEWTCGVRGSSGFIGSEDWIIVPPGKHPGPYPTIVYYEDGDIVDRHVGYSSQNNWLKRKIVMRQLFAKHPISTHYGS